MAKAMNKILKIIESLLVVIITITIFVVVMNFYQLKIQKKEYVNFFGYSMFEVISNSMAPTIEKKDIIIVKVTDDIKKDDIITYQKENAFVTHRVLEVHKKTYLARGDANNATDTPIEKDLVVGKVIKIFPSLGIWRDVLMDPKVLLAIVVTLSLFNYSFFKGDNDKIKNRRKYKEDFKITHSNIIEECDR